MLRVAVVEDETEYRGLIQEMVGRYAKEYDLQIQITAFQDGRELVQNYHKFDILLMDIEMPHLNGMEAAQKIRELDKEVVIVFITNMAQYAIKGYSRCAGFHFKTAELLYLFHAFYKSCGKSEKSGRKTDLSESPGWTEVSGQQRHLLCRDPEPDASLSHESRRIYDPRSIKGRAGRTGRLAFCKMQSVLSGKYEVCFRN